MENNHSMRSAEDIREHISKGIPVRLNDDTITPIDSPSLDIGEKGNANLFFSAANAFSCEIGTVDKIFKLLNYLQDESATDEPEMPIKKKERKQQIKSTQTAVLDAVNSVLATGNGVTETEVSHVIDVFCKNHNLTCLTEEKQFALRRFIREEISDLVSHARKDPKEQTKTDKEVSRATNAVIEKNAPILKSLQANPHNGSAFAILTPRERQHSLESSIRDIIERIASFLRRYPKRTDSKFFYKIYDQIRVLCLKNDALQALDSDQMNYLLQSFVEEVNEMFFAFRENQKPASSIDEAGLLSVEKLAQKENIEKFVTATEHAMKVWRNFLVLDMPWELDLNKKLKQLKNPSCPIEQKLKLIECFIWTLRTKTYSCKDQEGDAGQAFIKTLIATLEAMKLKELSGPALDFEASVIDYDPRIKIIKENAAEPAQKKGKTKEAKKTKPNEKAPNNKWRKFEIRETTEERRQRIMEAVIKKYVDVAYSKKLLKLATVLMSEKIISEIKSSIMLKNPGANSEAINELLRQSVLQQISSKITESAKQDMRKEAEESLDAKTKAKIIDEFAKQYQQETELETESGGRLLVKGEMKSRLKDLNRVTLKFLERPKDVAANLITDYWGNRCEVPDVESGLRLIHFLMREDGPLKANSRRDTLNLRCKNVFTEEAFNGHKKELGKLGFMSTKHSDASVYKYFQDMKITGETTEGINFELQIVLVGNTNETGLAHHAIYEAAQSAHVIAREFGFISKKQLEKLEKHAFNQSTDPEEKKAQFLAEMKQEVFLRKNPHISREDLEARPEEYRPFLEEINISTSVVNQKYTQYAQEKKEGIRERIRENLKEIKKDKFIYVEKELGNHRLEGLGILDETTEEILEAYRNNTQDKVQEILSMAA